MGYQQPYPPEPLYPSQPGYPQQPQNPYPQAPYPPQQPPYTQPLYPPQQPPYSQPLYPQPAYPPPQPYPPQAPQQRGNNLPLTITIAVASLVIISLLIFLAVRPGGFLNGGNSLSGTWHGQLTINNISGSGGPQQVVFEASGDLTQTNSTVSGTAQLCYNGGSGRGTDTIGGLSLSGTADGSNLSLTVSFSQQPGSSSTVTGTYSVSAGSASGQWTTADRGLNGTWSLTFQSGQQSVSAFNSACAALPTYQ